VLHAWWGVDLHIQDVCHQMAEAGYRALAPDLLSGNTPQSEEDASTAASELDPESAVATVSSFIAGLSSDRVALLGFSLGGSVALGAATRSKAVRVVVAFAGLWDLLPFEEMSAPIQAHVGELDPHVPADLRRSFSTAVKAAGGLLELYEYPRQTHGFYDHTRPEYDEAAAKGAWERALAAFQDVLSS
jgi:carboxymethylenebutenolidase